jgi:predicted HTH domain antitoxin
MGKTKLLYKLLAAQEELAREIIKKDQWKETARAFQETAQVLSEELSKVKAELERQRIPMLQYANLRVCFNQLIEEVLGKEYYNMGMDVYTCDRLTCEDIASKCSQPKIRERHPR